MRVSEKRPPPPPRALRLYNLLWCMLKRMPRECMFPKKDEKDDSESNACNFMNVLEAATAFPSSRSSHDLRVSRGFSLSLYHAHCHC